jgi:hypothetical protein
MNSAVVTRMAASFPSNSNDSNNVHAPVGKQSFSWIACELGELVQFIGADSPVLRGQIRPSYGPKVVVKRLSCGVLEVCAWCAFWSSYHWNAHAFRKGKRRSPFPAGSLISRLVLR